MADIALIDTIAQHEGKTVTVQGWVADKTDKGKLQFLRVRDGTGVIQATLFHKSVSPEAFDLAKHIPQESSVRVTGEVRKESRAPGGYELSVTDFEVVQPARDEYPITPKEHGIEFLADRRHLWLRSKRQWAIMRVRNRIIFAIHQFFQSQGFVQMDAPIFTGNACEGTSTLFETDYYGVPAYLSQSGQLYGEAMAMAMGTVVMSITATGRSR